MHSNQNSFYPRITLVWVLALTVAGCCTVQAPETDHAVAATSAPDANASAVYLSQARMIAAMMVMYPTVEVDVRWIPCGEENSYYSPGDKLIKLCTEMSAHPGAAIFFAAHEFGHAVTSQLADVLDEQAADEIGALAMLQLGLHDEVIEAALYHASQAHQGHYPGDSHPSNAYRAWELMCLEDGSEEFPVSKGCAGFYSALKLRWSLRLFDTVESPE